MRQYNLELLDTYGSEGKPIVFARLKAGEAADFEHSPPSLYVPLVA
jgi:hypothetical protein